MVRTRNKTAFACGEGGNLGRCRLQAEGVDRAAVDAADERIYQSLQNFTAEARSDQLCNRLVVLRPPDVSGKHRLTHCRAYKPAVLTAPDFLTRLRIRRNAQQVSSGNLYSVSRDHTHADDVAGATR